MGIRVGFSAALINQSKLRIEKNAGILTSLTFSPQCSISSSSWRRYWCFEGMYMMYSTYEIDIYFTDVFLEFLNRSWSSRLRIVDNHKSSSIEMLPKATH